MFVVVSFFIYGGRWNRHFLVLDSARWINMQLPWFNVFFVSRCHLSKTIRVFFFNFFFFHFGHSILRDETQERVVRSLLLFFSSLQFSCLGKYVQSRFYRKITINFSFPWFNSHNRLRNNGIPRHGTFSCHEKRNHWCFVSGFCSDRGHSKCRVRSSINQSQCTSKIPK